MNLERMIGLDENNPGGDHLYVLGGTYPQVRQTSVSMFLASIKASITTESRPLWRDYSYWDAPVNGQIAVANGVRGMLTRACISWGYQDPTFAAIYGQFAGYYRTSYGVLYTDQPLVKQADNWYAVHDELDANHPIPRWIDFEVNRPDAYEAKANALWGYTQIIYSRDGLWPVIYSRKGLIDLWLASWTAEMLNKFKWHLAQYLTDRTVEHPGPPTKPNRMNEENIILHQTADGKAGFPGEVGSKSVDWDRWCLGNDAQMHQWIVSHWGGTLPSGWHRDIDAWARTMGFNSPWPPPDN